MEKIKFTKISNGHYYFQSHAPYETKLFFQNFKNYSVLSNNKLSVYIFLGENKINEGSKVDCDEELDFLFKY
jgi:hypothetical protein